MDLRSPRFVSAIANKNMTDIADMPPKPYPVVAPGHTFGSVTDKISAVVLTQKVGKAWMAGAGICTVILMGFLSAVVYLFAKGVGIWGINIPVAWGFAIINFVWWVGIGHAGTFISAMLLLMRQDWRRRIN